jgi:bifunctional ADP-heptose synthase (sugar kinase/adenylyltransferase)
MSTRGGVTPTDLAPILALARSRRIVVFGDLIADEYVYGRVARVSREAPVLILEYDATEIVPGGAGNAANNIASLGGDVTLVSLVGRDEPGRRVLGALSRRVDRAGLVRPAAYRTPIKTRILAGGIHSAKQQVVRIDRLTGSAVSDRARAAAERAALRAVGRADAVLVSDYGSGLVTPRFVAELSAMLAARGRGRRGPHRASPGPLGSRRTVPILIDSRYALTRYRRLTACAPNESEVEHVLGVRIDERPGVLERAGRTLLRRTGMQAVLVTRGSRGMALFEPGRPTVHIPIVGSDQIADVTGAGDTVMAALTLALAGGATFEQAARLANYAGGLVVMKRGTATVSAAELRQALHGRNPLA